MAEELNYRETIRLVTSEGSEVLELDSFVNNDGTKVNVYKLVNCKQYDHVIVTSVKTGKIDEVLYPKMSEIMQSSIKLDIAIMREEEYLYVHDKLEHILTFGKDKDFLNFEYRENEAYVLTVDFMALGKKYRACIHKNRSVYIIDSYIQFNKRESREIADHLFDIFNIDINDFYKIKN